MATSDVDQEDSIFNFDAFTSGGDEDDPSAMSLVDHLEELRWRIFKSLIAIAVGTVIAFIFREYIVTFLTIPLPKEADSLTHGKPVITGLTAGFTMYLMISFAGGVVLSLPVILYQIWRFIAPGLYDREKKYAIPFIVIGVVMFVLGVSLAFVVLRFPVQFLVDFASNNFVELVSADSYFSFVAFFMLAFGVVFEMPLVLTFLAKVGIVSKETLTAKRPTAHIGMWIAATFLTPGADIYSPIILGAAILFLFSLFYCLIALCRPNLNHKIAMDVR